MLSLANAGLSIAFVYLQWYTFAAFNAFAVVFGIAAGMILSLCNDIRSLCDVARGLLATIKKTE
jgi:hypothetical protein